MRGLNPLSDRTWTLLSWGLFICLGVAIVSTFLDYGLTYDEEVARFYGRFVLRWYSTFFKDRSGLGYYNLHLYGGFFEATAQLTTSITQKILPIGVYETRHLVNALFGFFGIFCAYKLGAHLSGPSGGFFSAFFLALTPGFYGHIFNNSKDVPFAALFSFALYCIFRTYNQLPRVSIRLTVELSVVIGLVLGIRIGGVILFGYLALFWISWLFSQWIRGLRDRHELFITAATLACYFILIVIAAWAIMLVWWPWAQVSPLKHPYTALTATAHFHWPLTVFFNGRFMPGSALPATYLPTWLLISLPEFYFIALPLGCFVAFKSLTSFETRSPQAEWLTKLGLLVFAFCFPILAALILRSTMYDGMRQFLFILPSLAALVGILFAGFLKSDINKLIKLAVGMLILLSAGLAMLDMIQLHPYEYLYFNRLFAGGERSAAERFETDYWGSSYKEGAEWVINNYRPNSTELIRVANREVPFLIEYFFDKEAAGRFAVVPPTKNPSVYLAITRWQCHKMVEGKLLHTVERKGVPLLYIIEMQGSYRPEASTKMANAMHVEHN